MRLLIRFGYIGWLYTGYQTGNGERSVEDTILRTLRKAGIAEMVHSAARTDRGVSALSNTFAIDTTERAPKVMGILNSSIDGMLFHGYAIVPDDMNPRHCDYKTYRYYIPETEVGPYLRKALAPFRGRHDFSHYCKMDERNPVRTIKSISVRRSSGMVSVDFKSRSFLWNQIRTIMAYAVDHSYTEEQADPFSIESRYPKLMPPEQLILKDMVYPGIEFKDSVSLSKRRQFSEVIRESRVRDTITAAFHSYLG